MALDNRDKNFFIALAYTAAHESTLDLPAFRQKVSENQKVLSDIDSQQPLPKASVIDRSKLGI